MPPILLWRGRLSRKKSTISQIPIPRHQAGFLLSKEYMNYRTIDTSGQITAVITTPIQPGRLSELAKTIMGQNPLVEQVGYLQGNLFAMMGGELSINGLIAAAFTIGNSGKVNNCDFIIKKNTVSINLPMSIVSTINKNVVELEGINYKVIPGLPKNKKITITMKKMLLDMCIKSPAAGLIYYENQEIVPLIFVRATNTYVWENACGSGSLAYSMITSENRVIQPSGDVIIFNQLLDTITVTETVKEL